MPSIDGQREDCNSLLIMTKAPRNSFHEVTKANSATVTTAGTTAGRKIQVRTWSELAPSVTAASSSSWGTAAKAVAHDVQAERQLDDGVHDGQADE